MDGDAKSQCMDEKFPAGCEEHGVDWDRLKRRGERGSKEKFLEVLAKVPDVEPVDGDQLDQS